MTSEFYAVKGSPEWLEHRHCKRKRRFEVEPTAADHLPGWMRHYRCTFCDGWHLTSKPRTGSKKHEEAARDAERASALSRPERT